jgi:hypothetical protein
MCAGLLAAVALVAPGAALADESLHAVVSVTTGFTDNVLSASSDSPDLGVESDGFVLLSPGAVYARERPRSVHVASYVFGASMYLRHAEANSYTNRAAWGSRLALSPESELGLGASFVQGRISSVRASTPAAHAELGLEPVGGNNFVSLGGEQSFRRTIGRDWRVDQAANARMFKDLTNAARLGANYTAGTTASVTRRWRVDAATLSAAAYYAHMGSRRPAEDSLVPPVDGESQLVVGPELRWRRDVGRHWSTDVGAGFVAAARIDEPAERQWEPTALAALRYVVDEGAASLSWRRGVSYNVLVGQSTISDTVSLRGDLPLPWQDGLATSATIAYQRGHLLDFVDQSAAGTIDLWVLDAAAGWEIDEELSLGLRWQTIRQTRDGVRVPGVIENVSRTQVLLVVTGRYPGRQAAVLPGRDGYRVDQRDEGRFGDPRSFEGRDSR